MWVQVPSKSWWIGWMLYSYVGSSLLQITVDWFNALQLCGFKSSPNHTGLVECFTVMWVQVPSKSHWIGWMLYSYVGSSVLQVLLDWLNTLQLCALKTPPSHAGLVECFTAMWVQVLSKSCWIGWMLYRYVCWSHAGLVECFTATWVLVPSKSHWIGWMLYSCMRSSPLQVTLDWLNALQLCGFKYSPSQGGLVEFFTAMCVQDPSKSCWIGWMLYSYVGSSVLKVMLDWLNALQLHGLKSPPSHGGLVECFAAMWVQVPFKLCWIGWMLYSYVDSSSLQVTVDWLNALQLCGFKSPPSHAGLVECFTAMWVQVSLDWLNTLQLCGFKSPISHAGLVECFTTMWVQVPSKSRWIGWMLYSYVGSSPLQVTLDWLIALQIRGFKSCWIGWMLYSYVGSGPLQVTLNWLNALQLHMFKSPPSCAGLVECFTAMWVQVPSKSQWIGWMLYSYVGSRPLQVTLDWLNALQLFGFKCPPSHGGLVECFTATWAQVPSK